MKQNQRYIVVFALLLLIAGIGGGFWAWKSFTGSSPKSAPVKQTVITPTSTAHSGSLIMNRNARLLISKIGVDAPIELVNTLPNNKLDVPTRNPWEGVGWYQGGPVPGDPGSAVIDGHLDRPGGKPAVFWRLHELKIGDRVVVQDAQQHALTFEVYKSETYPPDKAPADQIFGNTSGKYLNLITCAGEWIPAEQQTSLRLVVYTKLVAA